MAHRSFLFSATDGTNGQELWVSDGTPAGTKLLADINPGSSTSGGGVVANSSQPSNFANVGSNLAVFSATDSNNDRELWITDGTTSGTKLLTNIYQGYSATASGTTANSSYPSSITSIGNGRAVFSATNDINGSELWTTDGTNSGTKLLVDVLPGKTGSNPTDITYIGAGRVLFAGYTGNSGYGPGSNGLYSTDTISGDTRLLYQQTLISGITPLNNSYNIFSSYIAGNYAVGSTDGLNNTGILSTSYGTNLRTSYIAKSFPVVSTGHALIVGGDGTRTGLWITDGTSSNTKLVIDGTGSTGPSNINGVTALGNGLAVFYATDNLHGSELWVSDGSNAGTHIIDDINPSSSTSNGTSYPLSSVPTGFTALGNGRAVFSANDGMAGSELWVTDGTSVGTHLVMDIYAGSTGSNPTSFMALGDGRVTFQATDASHGTELWVTDGTNGGTHLISDINPGSGNSNAIGIYSTSFVPASSENFNFKLTEAKFNFVNGIKLITGPDGIDHDVTGIRSLTFSDGVITAHSSYALVDDLFYYANNGDVWGAHLDTTAHFNQNGWHEGRDPSNFFSTNGYLAANQDVAKAGINPLSHYDANGWKEGRDPSASFDNELYLLNNPDVKAAGIDPLAHYLQSGQAEGRQAYAAIGNATSFTHGSFDAEYYLLANPDVAKVALTAGGDTFAFAFQHYQANGWKEGRAPDAYFDSAYYLAHNPDVAAAGVDPLFHYDQVGWKEGRDPSAAFHTKAYLATNPDVAAAHIDPLTHYLQYGADEGRHLA